MKIEMHCHTREGSPDGLVGIEEIVEGLKRKGYDGMVVTDHNSYRGYESVSGKEFGGFVIIKGIEYDTSDAGHLLIILPDGVENDIFTNRGMGVRTVLEIVRVLGGIVGPAHPFDYYKLGMFNNMRWLKNVDILREFDFIEGFNACGNELGNNKSKMLSKMYNKPMVGGSDTHQLGSIGKGYTKLPGEVRNADELIEMIKGLSYGGTEVGGEYFDGTMEKRHKYLHGIGIRTFYLYNWCISQYKGRLATRTLKTMGILQEY